MPTIKKSILLSKQIRQSFLTQKHSHQKPWKSYRHCPQKVVQKAVHWSSRVPKQYERNAITGELHRAKRISDDVEEEVLKIKEKFRKANYPARFVESVNADESTMIPLQHYLKKINLPFRNLPFRERNENISKTFIKKLHKFTDNKYNAAIKWLTKKTSSLFHIKDSCKIYKGDCSCGEMYRRNKKKCFNSMERA